MRPDEFHAPDTSDDEFVAGAMMWRSAPPYWRGRRLAALEMTAFRLTPRFSQHFGRHRLRKDGEAINYQERSPLVIPRQCLAAAERSDAVVAKNPAWPVDPDVKRRQEEAALERDQNKLNADEPCGMTRAC